MDPWYVLVLNSNENIIMRKISSDISIYKLSPRIIFHIFDKTALERKTHSWKKKKEADNRGQKTKSRMKCLAWGHTGS